MVSSLNHIISEIQRKEKAISLTSPNEIDEAYQMTIYLKEYLWSIREDVTKQGFKNYWEEINFFRNIKPYILQKINDDEMADFSVRDISDGILWTDTKNALIELIYALYANSSLSNGKIGIRKISLTLERMFQISLGDLHHSFHRMKYRAGSRTTFLDQLKSSLEEYMDKDL